MRMQSRGCHTHVVAYVDNYLSGAGIGRPINFISIVLTDKVLAT